MEVNEQSTAYLTVEFRDKAGDLQAPSSARYRVDCPAPSSELRAWTALGAASSVEIELNAEDNTMVNGNRPYELRRVTVEATYGADDKLVAEFDYRVRNLEFYP